MKSVFEILEFDKLKDLLNEYTQTIYGKNYISQIKPLFDYKKAQEHTQILEIFFETLANANLILEDIYIDDYLNKALYSALNAKEIYHIYTFIDFISLLHENLDDKLKKYIVFYNLDKLKSLIYQTIDETGYIKDSSTKKLFYIRNRIKSIKEEITAILRSYIQKKGLQNILLDTNIFLKNSRFTILVKPNYNEYIKSRKIDISKAGFFVEPYEVFEKNNFLEELILEETKEIQKILNALTNLIRKHTNELLHNTIELAKLDAIYAKILFAKAYKAKLAHFDEKKRLEAHNIKHPLLLKVNQNVVANSIKLEGTLVITGPNTGGKTVFIKQIGLAVLCAYAGIPICAEYLVIGKISNIFAVIGDEQETESLSTFSSNMVRIKQIIDNSDENSLILLDEPGSGTSPDEAFAIVYAIVVYLTKKNPLLIISTHYKNLVYKLKELDNVFLAAFEFDESNMKPTYRLVYGKIGKSYGIEIMQKYLNDEIFEIAKKTHESKESETLDKYEKELDEMLRKKTLYTNLIKRYKTFFKKLSLDSINLKNKLLQEHNEVTNQYTNYVNLLKKEISKVIKSREIKDAQTLINTLKKNQREIHIEDKNITFEKGDIVQLGKSTGMIVNLKGTYAQVNINGKIVETKTSTLKKRILKKQQNNINIMQPVKEINELNIIGMHTFEAEMEVLQFLEYAAKNEIKEVRIIHGKGTGALKEMVRQLLKTHKSVESFSMAPPNLGGDGATIVYLK